MVSRLDEDRHWLKAATGLSAIGMNYSDWTECIHPEDRSAAEDQLRYAIESTGMLVRIRDIGIDFALRDLVPA